DVPVASFQGNAVKPQDDDFGCEAFPQSRMVWKTIANGVLKRAIVMKQRRRTHKLKGSQTGVSEQMNQRHIMESQSNFGNDDANLGERRKRQSGFDIGLYAAAQVGE